MNDRILISKGMDILSENLGLVEAERFISLILSDRFDYTEWRRDNLFQDMSIEQISKEAMAYRKSAQ